MSQVGVWELSNHLPTGKREEERRERGKERGQGRGSSRGRENARCVGPGWGRSRSKLVCLCALLTLALPRNRTGKGCLSVGKNVLLIGGCRDPGILRCERRMRECQVLCPWGRGGQPPVRLKAFGLFETWPHRR